MTASEWLSQQELVDEYVEADREWVPFIALTFDKDMAGGQCREKNHDHVAHLKASMQTNPQRPPLEGLLMVRNKGTNPFPVLFRLFFWGA
jgi:hypothetical protein